ncbi:sugar transporter SWEET1 isoform X2 [Dermatophagoides farinae]|nr:sugar transporter SWEET1-like isoform X2 [Dermatophagoides farinae]
MALIEFVGQVATIFTLFSFLTGIPICRSIQLAGSTDNFSSLPFLVGNMCGYLWLRYGFMLDDPTMIFVNVIGFTLQSIYLFWFYLYTVPKSKINRPIIAVLSFIFFVHLYIQYSIEPEYLVGLMACLSSLFFSISPMPLVFEVIRSKCTERLPFSLIASSFMVTLLWFIYGSLIGDSFVKIPNGIGAIIYGIQLSLFAIYPSKRNIQ